MPLDFGKRSGMPRVSIIVPAYNVERYISEALESAVGQTYTDHEIIVVNDGSTDSTAKVIDTFAHKVVCIEQENRGLAATRNVAINACSGELIALLDSDDVWVPDRLERLVSFIDAHPRHLAVTTDSYLIEEDRYTQRSVYRDLPPRWRFKNSRQDYWITQFNFMQIHTLFRSSLIERYGLFDEGLRSCEDWDLWTRALLSSETFGCLDEPLAYYRLRQGSLSIDRSKLLPDEITVLEKAIATGKALPGALGRLSYTKGKLAVSAGRFDEARTHFLQAARDPKLYWPFRMKASIAALAPRRAWNSRGGH